MIELLIFGDIAGQYDALQRLIKKADRPNAKLVSVGDMIDRGPDSDKVVDFFLDHLAILGNHEDMMLDVILGQNRYANMPEIWYRNGGIPTLECYEKLNGHGNDGKVEIDKSHIEFLLGLPLYLEFDNLIITHAPISPYMSLTESKNTPPHFIDSLCWNREDPEMISGLFQVYGHNSRPYIEWHDDWGVCLDASKAKVLTAMHWPSKTIYQEEW